MSSGQRLAVLLESIPILRKRFRKGRDWIREPGETSGDNVLQTTKAIELNFSTLRTVFKWMPSQKLSITTLEPEAWYLKILAKTTSRHHIIMHGNPSVFMGSMKFQMLS